jgi:hypothetical protein
MIGALFYLKSVHPKEGFEAVATFLKEAGVLCVVFGVIEAYMEAGREADEKPRLGIRARNVDVVIVGLFAVAAGIVVAAGGRP